jgi:hypothetical protein
MRGSRTRGRRLLVTLALLLAGAGVRHVIEVRARRLSISERGPVAALPPPTEPPDADVSAESPTQVEPVVSRDSEGPTLGPGVSDLPAQPVSATDNAESAGPPPPAQPVTGDVDAESARQFPAELQEQAADNPGGWVYEIDPGCNRRGPVAPEHIIGAWRIDDQGSPTGEFVANSLYRPAAPTKRWRRRPRSGRGRIEGS